MDHFAPFFGPQIHKTGCFLAPSVCGLDAALPRCCAPSLLPSALTHHSWTERSAEPASSEIGGADLGRMGAVRDVHGQGGRRSCAPRPHRACLGCSRRRGSYSSKSPTGKARNQSKCLNDSSVQGLTRPWDRTVACSELIFSADRLPSGHLGWQESGSNSDLCGLTVAAQLVTRAAELQKPSEERCSGYGDGSSTGSEDSNGGRDVLGLQTWLVLGGCHSGTAVLWPRLSPSCPVEGTPES